MKIKVEGVNKTFKTKNGIHKALDDINLEIKAGEFVSLVGPSGCGKSTLLNLMADLDIPDSGTIFTNGRAHGTKPAETVLIFQEPALFPWLTTMKNVEFGLKMAGVRKEERKKIALKHLKMVHLSRFHDTYVHELSGGMKQRVALARALALDPDILLMDEPFAALDAQTREFLHTELQEIWARTKKTIFFVTHNVREAVVLGDRVLVFSACPGHIKKEFKVDIPRPRNMGSVAVLDLCNEIMKELKTEIEKVVKEEMDAGWKVEHGAIQKSAAAHHTDRALGGSL